MIIANSEVRASLPIYHLIIYHYLFCLDHTLFTPFGVNNAQLLRDSEPIRLLETPRPLCE